MKAKKNFLNFFSLLAIVNFIAIYDLNAQSTKQTMAMEHPSTFCDDDIAINKTELEKKANTTCLTAMKTIACNDKKTGLPVHVTLCVQPDLKSCPNSIKVENVVNDEPQSRGAVKTDFSVEVVQNRCNNSNGVILTAYIPGFDAASKKKIYDFQWLSEGEIFDTDNQTECIEHNKITLKVKNIASEQMVIKSITIQAETPSANKDYKMFGYEKTACYGTCPVYKVAINKNGKATWDGIANVDRTGKWEAMLDERKIKELKDAAFKANFFELSRKYPIEGEVADASKTITYFRTGDMEKTISNAFGGPDELVGYEEFLEKTISNLNWKRIAPSKSK